MSNRNNESFKPVPVTLPADSPLKYRLRCLLDLQLATIVKFLRPSLAALAPGRILDVGAGQSPWRGWLPPGSSYVGIDIANAHEFGMTAKDNIVFYDGRHIPFGEQCFDGAICIEVLEHAEDPEALLREIGRVLRPDAMLLLTVPWSARRHHIPFDFHRFTRERLENLLCAAGFAGIEIHERGDDIAVIANKLLVVTIRTAKGVSVKNFIATIPLALGFGMLAALMLAAAHVSMSFRLGSPEDPLGYFCSARKAPIPSTT